MPLILLRCDGRTLEARRVGRVSVRFVADQGMPIKGAPWQLLEDDEAARVLRTLEESGLYTRDSALQTS